MLAKSVTGPSGNRAAWPLLMAKFQRISFEALSCSAVMLWSSSRLAGMLRFLIDEPSMSVLAKPSEGPPERARSLDRASGWRISGNAAES